MATTRRDLTDTEVQGRHLILVYLDPPRPALLHEVSLAEELMAQYLNLIKELIAD